MAKQTDRLSCACIREQGALILQQFIYMLQTVTRTEFSVNILQQFIYMLQTVTRTELSVNILQQFIYMLQTVTRTEFSVYTVWCDMNDPIPVVARS
jgi:hypothetical protein